MGLWPEEDPAMDARDPNNLNDYLKVQFDEVFGEPEQAHAIDCVWRNSYKCFNCCFKLCYLIMSTLCSILMAFCWGCEFAMLTFCSIWCWMPCYRELEIFILCARKFMNLCLECTLGLVCEHCGALFTAFKK